MINHIFKTHLIQAAITFHGGTQSISKILFFNVKFSLAYPWGAFNHILNPGSHQAEECPDDKAFTGIISYLSISLKS